MLFNLQIDPPNVSVGQMQVVTSTTVSSLQPVLPTPTFQNQPLLAPPNVPHLREQNIIVRICPTAVLDDNVFLFQPYLQPHFFDNHISTEMENSMVIRAIASVIPSFQFQIGKRIGKTTERIPLSEAIDINNVYFGEEAGEHY